MKVTIGFAILITCSVIANLFMKTGAMVAPEQKIIFGLLSWRSIIGLFFFGLGGLAYAWVLQWVNLSIAQSFMSAQFVAVILASAILLSEPIPLARWFGIALIACGIIVVGSTRQ